MASFTANDTATLSGPFIQFIVSPLYNPRTPSVCAIFITACRVLMPILPKTCTRPANNAERIRDALRQ